ncbi:MAG: GNAT family N-acetyltransferase [Anaerolineales bacterium]|nr:GNAT family N-acetyltransferase [Anaerolineales bacterium]
MRVRKATIIDSAGLAKVQVDSYRIAYAGILPQDYLDLFTYAEQTQDWRELLSNRMDDLLYVAETEAGEITGYALGRPGVSDIPTYDSELVALHVRLPCQGKGIGRQLSQTIAAQLKASGCTSMMLWVLAQNQRARQFYEELGGELLDQTKQSGAGALEVAYGWDELNSLT